MHETSLLTAWQSYYAMIGSSTAALTGLMFVVITLMNSEDRAATEAGVSTFSTPTVLHFSVALFVSAIMSMPLSSLVPVDVVIGFVGIAGCTYTVRIAIRTARMETYEADAEDWTWHALLPFIAYAVLVVGAIVMPGAPVPALFAPALSVVLLIFIGIHNAWDVVTYIAVNRSEDTDSKTGD